MECKKPTEEISLLKDVVSRLESANIEYMVTGSMVLSVYSIPRMTRDIDIIIQVSTRDVGKIIALFRNEFYIDEASVRQAIFDRGMFNIIHNTTVIKIDFIVRKDEPYRIEEFSRKKTSMIDGSPVSVVALEDLILSKLLWVKLSESELQMRDIRALLSAAQGMDRAYLQKWSKALGVEDLLRRIENHA